jgi:hypothetical protein
MSETVVNSARTRAVLVAVESYELTGQKLDGPARDAVRFLEWLKGRGVHPDQITLLASPLATNLAMIQGTGITHRPATRQSIYDLFVNELPKTSGDGCGRNLM